GPATEFSLTCDPPISCASSRTHLFATRGLLDPHQQPLLCFLGADMHQHRRLGLRQVVKARFEYTVLGLADRPGGALVLLVNGPVDRRRRLHDAVVVVAADDAGVVHRKLEEIVRGLLVAGDERKDAQRLPIGRGRRVRGLALHGQRRRLLGELLGRTGVLAADVDRVVLVDDVRTVAVVVWRLAGGSDVTIDGAPPRGRPSGASGPRGRRPTTRMRRVPGRVEAVVVAESGADGAAGDRHAAA